MRKAVNVLFAVCISLLIVVMLAACNEAKDESIEHKAKCEDCNADKPSYCVNYKTDKEAYYCFDCYWENHYFEKPAIQISYDKWWE